MIPAALVTVVILADTHLQEELWMAFVPIGTQKEAITEVRCKR